MTREEIETRLKDVIVSALDLEDLTAADIQTDAPLFGSFFLSTATRIVATAQQIEIGEVAVLTIAITEGDAMPVGYGAVGLFPDVAMFQYHLLPCLQP